ncbi:MAG: squalene synthase HpnC [Ignavibacteria bacterium]|nr:squalene synthase HpnC [Ignavibacteria bacterium]MBI3765510.1 squalene synthase HpnC [Ignavibacteriales bacterium]
MNTDTLQETTKSYTVDEAFQYCADITNAHYENFPVASLFLPQEKRPYIQSVYAFSRVADDFADELDRTPDERLQHLDRWDEQLRLCYEGIADHPIFIALRESVKRVNIPIDPLKDLLTAFKRDVTQNRYETFEDLLSYCRCSANPVGRIVLMIFGYRDENLFSLSDHICTALQLTNFWQDIVLDREKDRLYIPLEDMRRFGYSIEQWKDEVMNDAFRLLMKHEVNRTRDLFSQGAPLPSLVERDLQLELKLVWFGGMSVLKMIERNRYDVLHSRPKLSVFSMILILFRGLFYDDLVKYAEKHKPKEPWDLT